jgi:signal transduction histidine kinase
VPHRLYGASTLRVSIKLTLALIAMGVVIFGAYGAYELQAERHNLRVVIEQEVRLLGQSLRVAIENALRDQQLVDIEKIVKNLNGIAPSIDILVYDTKGHLLTFMQRRQPPDPMHESALQTALSSQAVVFRFDPPDDSNRAIFATPLTDDNGVLLGGLLINRPLLDLQRVLQEMQRGIALFILLFFLTTLVLGLVLGTIYIGRPSGRMVTAMREVRSGNLTSVLPANRKDEMGTIAAEFNAMVAELREARRQLEEEAEAQRRTQRALQEADKLITIGQLSAGLAHEIGSPLQILNGRARALLNRADDAEEVRRNAEILVAQTDRITRIVEQLLHFARRRTLPPARNDLRTAVNSVLDLLQYEARRRGISLTFSCTPDLPPRPVETDGIQQIVLNLVTNALAATPDKGRVSVSLELKRSSPTGEKEEISAVRLVVSDTGNGMSQEVREHIFEPFFTTRSAEGGTGLGLAVVKALVTEYDGTIEVASEPGAGSRFIIDLPVPSTATKAGGQS